MGVYFTAVTKERIEIGDEFVLGFLVSERVMGILAGILFLTAYGPGQGEWHMA